MNTTITTAMNATQTQPNATDMQPTSPTTTPSTTAMKLSDSTPHEPATPLAAPGPTAIAIESQSQKLARKKINKASRLLAEACLLLDRDEITLTVVNIKAPIRPPVTHDGPSPSDFRKDEIAYFHSSNNSGPFIGWVKAIWDDTGFVFATVGHGENERFITRPQPAVKHES
jgi:hypothetical protein